MRDSSRKFKITSRLTIFYSTKKSILVIKGPELTKSLKLKLKLTIKSQTITITKSFRGRWSNPQKKKVRSLQKTTLTLIKRLSYETSITFYEKLHFVGVGFRAFELDPSEGQLFLLRLGYSHPIYYKPPARTGMFCLKFTKIFIYSSSCLSASQEAAKMRSYKKPDPYKGKGIRYRGEILKLKEGKKV